MSVTDVADLAILDVPAEAHRLTSMRAELLGWLSASGAPDARAHDVTLAAYEALANSVEHAYSGGGGTVSLIASGGGVDPIEVVVEDNGGWHESVASPLRGRGLPLIHALADEVDVDAGSGGTRVRMVWGAFVDDGEGVQSAVAG